MKSINFIGDIHGNYIELLELSNLMPPGEFISVGDIIDRGPNSKKVIEFFMKNGRVILGNHEHMMLDFFNNNGSYYAYDAWILNGGVPTIKSFLNKKNIEKLSTIKLFNLKDFLTPYISSSILNWLSSLPLYIQENDFIVTHGSINPSIPFEKTLNIGKNAFDVRCETSILWNRGKPRRKEKFQIHGHTPHIKAFEYKDKKGVFGINLDTSSEEYITGMHWPSKEIFSVKIKNELLL